MFIQYLYPMLNSGTTTILLVFMVSLLKMGFSGGSEVKASFQDAHGLVYVYIYINKLLQHNVQFSHSVVSDSLRHKVILFYGKTTDWITCD